MHICTHTHLCACVRVCVRERKRKGDRERTYKVINLGPEYMKFIVLVLQVFFKFYILFVWRGIIFSFSFLLTILKYVMICKYMFFSVFNGDRKK